MRGCLAWMVLAQEAMANPLLKLSRAVFHWPPLPASSREKQALVTRLGRLRGINNFIETGTFEGDMVEAQREVFRTIATIELSEKFWEAARGRFAAWPHIHVLHGDSGAMLPEAMRLVSGPALYWLDAHYSKGETARGEAETPVLKELSLIAARGQAGDVILIDDARLFGWRRGYPRLARVRSFVTRHWPGCAVTIESDVICIVPQ